MPADMAWQQQTRLKSMYHTTVLDLTSHPGSRQFPLDETNVETDAGQEAEANVSLSQRLGEINVNAKEQSTGDAVQETEKPIAEKFRKSGGISVEETCPPGNNYSENLDATGYAPHGPSRHAQESSTPQPNVYSFTGFGPNVQTTNNSSTSYRVPSHSTNSAPSFPNMPHMPGVFTSGPGATYHIQGPVQIGSNNQIIYHGGSRPLSTSNQKKAPKQVRVTGSKRPVNSSDLDKVEKHIGSKWRPIGRKLGLDDAELDEINHDYHVDGLREKAHQVLRHWVDCNGDDATLTKLARTLAEVGLYDIAMSLK